ncbi:MAG: NosL protein [Gammaproteobacteria bacterium]|nr:NosL protein [Gammaproteobacteria bacterium]
MIFLTIAGCENTEVKDQSRGAGIFHDSDECHVCGMVIARFSGPKAMVYLRKQPEAIRFCSTHELFIWLLQPESAAIVETIYVHDMGGEGWDDPDHPVMLEARNAWYVLDEKKRVAMGVMLAPFSREEAALRYIKENGGRLLRFDEIDLLLLQSIMPSPVDYSEPQS